MDILINELSLDGQFADENDFLNSLKNILPIIKIIDNLEFVLFKNNLFFDSNITATKKFSDIAYLRDDRVRRVKSFLVKLSTTPPYWNDTQIHNCSDKYFYNSKDVCGTSLAETYERDKIVLSFNHINFLRECLSVQKNDSSCNIYNIIDKNIFLDYLLTINQIDTLNYCKDRFKNTNLNFSLLENDFGFDTLNYNQINEFIATFRMFTAMTWTDISKSDGLEYKKYNKPKKISTKGWFRKGDYQNTDIYKFRTTKGYRCFGYRDGNIFYILRFEIDHTISDYG